MSVHLPTLRQLQYLVALSEELHFGRAAERCHVTQSTLSAGLQELEAILDVTVVERTKRRVNVTPFGEELVARARRVLAEVEDMTVMAKASDTPLTGLLRFGAIPTIAPYVFPRILPPLRASYPELRLYLREDKTDDLVARLGRGDLDVALIALPYEVDSLDVVVLADDPFWFAVAANHPQAADTTPIAPEAIEIDDLLLLEDGHCLRDHALSACRQSAVARSNNAFQATSLYTLVELVADGFGTTLLPEIALNSEQIGSSSIVTRPLSNRVGRQIALAWRHHSPRRAEFKLLGQFLRTCLARKNTV